VRARKPASLACDLAPMSVDPPVGAYQVEMRALCTRKRASGTELLSTHAAHADFASPTTREALFGDQ
jgi:hypothetical protein